MGDPTVVVEDLEQICAAVAAASAAQMRLTIRSAPWVAGAYGPPVFAAMIEAAREAHPGVGLIAVLDCGSSAGLAMTALRHGLDVRVDLPPGVRVKLADLAARMGRNIEQDDGPVLNLAGSRRPEADCRSWFADLASRG